MHDIPPLPDGVFLQVFVRETALTWRVTDDGQWLVTRPGQQEQPERPLSRYRKGRDRLDDAALSRLRAALEQVGFDALPPVLSAGLPEGSVLVNGHTYTPKHLAFTARLASSVHTVEVEADLAVSESLGALAPLYTALDNEAIGGWMYE